MEQVSFDVFYREHAPTVLAYCLRRADRQTAEDAMSEVFIVAWRRRDEASAEALPWLLAIARRTLANQRRSVRRQGALLARLAAQPLLRPRRIRVSRVLEALAALRESDREVLRLAAWEALSSREAARVLGCTSAAYRLRLHRARRRLARALARLDVRRPARTARARFGSSPRSRSLVSEPRPDRAPARRGSSRRGRSRRARGTGGRAAAGRGCPGRAGES